MMGTMNLPVAARHQRELLIPASILLRIGSESRYPCRLPPGETAPRLPRAARRSRRHDLPNPKRTRACPNDINAALIERDRSHLIHPLHSGHRPRARQGLGPRRGRDALRRERRCVHRRARGAVEQHLRERAQGASRTRRRPRCSISATPRDMRAARTPNAIALAERLAGLAYPCINRFYFTSGGGESTDSNIKMARYYWKLKGRPEKTKVISRMLGYHGVTLAAMCATGIPAYWPMFEPRIPGFVHIPSPYPYRYEAPEGMSQGIAAANELEKMILEEGPETVAMFIAEPVHGAGGVIPPQNDYFPAHPRDLRPVRRAALRRRGDHRLRPHRPDVRARALGRAARSHAVREGDHLRLLPARRHRGERRDRGHHGRQRAALDARLYVQRPPGRLRGRARDPRHHRRRELPRPGRGEGASGCWWA